MHAFSQSKPVAPEISFFRFFHTLSVHVYLTYPFVLSWSMLEAMSTGCLVVGSRTPPVEEVISHGKNGLLFHFFSPSELVERVDEVLDHPDRMQALRVSARRTIIERYDLKRVCLPRQLKLIEELASRTERKTAALSVPQVPLE